MGKVGREEGETPLPSRRRPGRFYLFPDHPCPPSPSAHYYTSKDKRIGGVGGGMAMNAWNGREKCQTEIENDFFSLSLSSHLASGRRRGVRADTGWGLAFRQSYGRTGWRWGGGGDIAQEEGNRRREVN